MPLCSLMSQGRRAARRSTPRRRALTLEPTSASAFGLLTLISLGSALWPGSQRSGAALAVAFAFLALCIANVLVAPTARRRRSLAAPLCYIGFAAALAQSEGGIGHSGLDALSLLAVVWAALGGEQRDTAIVVVAASLADVALAVVGHESALLASRRGITESLVAVGAGVAVHGMRARFSSVLRERDLGARRARDLAAALQRLTALRTADEVIATATELAGELAAGAEPGRHPALYLAITGDTATIAAHRDGRGHRLAGAWAVSDHPLLHAAVATERPVVGEASRCSGRMAVLVDLLQITHACYVPVLHAGQVHGVLVIGDAERPLPEHVLGVACSLARMIEIGLDTARRSAELSREARLDPLTGCLNRRGLEDAVAGGGPLAFAVIAADLDGLKLINDAFGHEEGDAAIGRFATVLRAAVREDDVVARTGGDEFVVLLRGASAARARATAELVCEEMAAIKVLSPTRASFGIAAGDDLSDFADVAARADKAMYAAKRSGGMRVVEWDQLSTSRRGDAPGEPLVLAR